MSKAKISLVAATLLLAGCGGGGGGNVQEEGGFAPQAPRIDVLPVAASLPSNVNQFPPETNSPFLTPVTVRITQSNGQIIPDGTLIFLRTNNIRVAALSPQTANNALALADVTCVQSFGGQGGFLVHSGPEAGTVQLSGSVTFPPQPGTIADNNGIRTCTQPFLNPGSQSYVGNIAFTVVPGPAPFERLAVVPRRTTLPANTQNVPVTLPTSPFVTEVELTFRSLGGVLVQSGTVNLSINPAIARFSVPDDPATEVNEFTTLVSQGQVPIVAGKGIIYVHSTSQPGTFTLTATTTDPGTGAVVSKQVTFTVSGTSVGVPSQVRITGPSNVVYVSGSNGNTTAPIVVNVTDADGQSVVDSASANVLLEILPVSNGSGEVLTASGVADGQLVRVRTVNGQALASYRAGTRQGLVTVRATADRADNNVDNGIQNAVISQTSFVVSDGRLFDLEITSPIINAVQANGVDPDAEPVNFDLGNGQSIMIPPQLDGTYRLTVSVVATDRQGNPVLENTPIEFGMVDEPVVGYPEQGAGSFLISGTDGDPQEEGSLFTSASGRFIGSGGTGAGPGDTLIVFGEGSAGNRDLESARIVLRVNSATSLSIQNRFNRNDDTGGIVNNGPVLPYIIGRNTTGNIASNKLTRADGVAITTMTYPVSQLGKAVVVWARGQGDVVNGSPELVTDAELFRFPGIAPGSLVVSPALIPANRTSLVTICYQDALRSGIAGIFPDFVVTGSALTTVDGVPGSGTVARATDRSGCTVASVNTLGVVVADNTSITFSVGGSTGVVQVAGANSPVLQAIPTQLGGQGGQVLLRLLDGNGNPIPGVQLVGSCTVAGGTGAGGTNFTASIQTPPGTTNALGETFAVIGASLDAAGSSGSATCTFTTASAGGPTATVRLQGIDVCNIVVSPLCPATTRTQASLNVQLDRGAAPNGPGSGIVTGSAGGINCSTAAPASGCTGQVDVGTVVRLTAVADPSSQFCGWSGAQECDTTAPVVNVSVTTNKICVARFRLAAPAACSP